MDKVFTIPLRKEFLKAPKWKRSKRSVRAVKDYLKRHMKVEEVKLNAELNEEIWKRGSKNPPSKVKVHAKVEDGTAWANLWDKEILIPQKVEKEEVEDKEEERDVDEGKANVSRADPEKKVR